MQLRRDERGQSLGISNFVLSLIGGALVIYFLVQRIGGAFQERAAGQGGEIGTTSTHWLNLSGEFLPVFFVVVAMFGLLIRAVNQRGQA